jgi:hypothetical protein
MWQRKSGTKEQGSESVGYFDENIMKPRQIIEW